MFANVIIDEDTKLWRFQSMVLRRLEDSVEYRVINPVPVVAGGKLVGFATVYNEYGHILADVAADYALPERLDVENGKKLYTLPRVQICRAEDADEKSKFEGSFYVWGTQPFELVTRIVALQLREDCTDVEQPAIGKIIL